MQGVEVIKFREKCHESFFLNVIFVYSILCWGEIILWVTDLLKSVNLLPTALYLSLYSL